MNATKEVSTELLASTVTENEALKSQIAEMKRAIEIANSKPTKTKVRAAKGNSECAKRISESSTLIREAKEIREKQDENKEILLAAGMDEKQVNNFISAALREAVMKEEGAQNKLVSVVNACSKVLDLAKNEKNLDNLLETTRNLYDGLGHLIPNIATK